MSARAEQQPPEAARRRGLPRWAQFLIAVVVLIAVLAAVVAVFAGRGRGVTAGPHQRGTSVPTAPSSPAPTQPPATLADGCLGGAVDLDRAVQTAQEQAALTPAGAASFSATLVRWAFTAPAPPRQQDLSSSLLSGDATDNARLSLSHLTKVSSQSVVVDFTQGRYLVEAVDTAGDPATAAVSYLATVHATADGQALSPAYVGGTVHLVADDGHWHYRDLTGERTIANLQNAGTPYAGGC